MLLDAPPVEFSEREWKERGPALAHRRAKHDPGCRGCSVHIVDRALCPEDCQWRCRVFLCRDTDGGRHTGYACGAYVGACLGGSDDNRCAVCWCALMKSIKRRIVSYVRNAPAGRRREDAISRKFAQRTWGEKPPDEDSEVIDLLNDLVREGTLGWDDEDNDRGAPGRPLWYRVAKRRKA